MAMDFTFPPGHREFFLGGPVPHGWIVIELPAEQLAALFGVPLRDLPPELFVAERGAH